MKQKIFRGIYNSSLIKKFLASPSPSWLVWAADTAIVLLACLLTVVFGAGKTSYPSIFFAIPVKVTVCVAIYAAINTLFATYRYVVRLSSLIDVARTIKLIIASSLVLALISLTTWLATGVSYISFWNIFVIGVIAFSMMTLMRLFIKSIYSFLMQPGKVRQRVVVLGTHIDSLMLAAALKDEIDGSYTPVALLSRGTNPPKTANGIPIFKLNPETIEETFRVLRANTLIFTSSQMELMRQQLADIFLSHSIKLLMFNSVEEFSMADDDNTDHNISAHVQNIHIEDLLGRAPINTGNKKVREVYFQQTVMVTGAAGSIGSEIVNQLASFGAKDLVLIDQAETPMHELQLRMQERHPGIQIHLFIGDIANRERMEQAFSKYRPRYVFHAAAYKHVPMMEMNPSEAVCTNIFGTKNIADLAVEYNVEKFVMVSTDKAVNPTNIMGASKRIAEIYVQSLFFKLRRNTDGPTTQFITTRFGNVLGSNGSVIPLFKRQIEEGGPVTVTHRDIIRYFMTIPEACSLVLEAACMGAGGEIYIFDMGKPVKIYDLARKMISLAGLRPDIDIKIVETGLRPGEKLYEELLSDKERTIATHHRQIMIAKVVTYDYDNVVGQLNELERDIHSANLHDIVAQMKRIVPEFVSNNSKWAEIDKELAAQAGN